MPKKPTKPAPKKRSKPDWSTKFLKAIAETGNITAAAKAAGINRDTFYQRRDTDKTFAAAVADALESATDALELEARRRAQHGTEKPVYQGGKRVGTVQEYSDTLLIFLLKAHRPEKYREKIDHRHGGAAELPPIRYIEAVQPHAANDPKPNGSNP